MTAQCSRDLAPPWVTVLPKDSGVGPSVCRTAGGRLGRHGDKRGREPGDTEGRGSRWGWARRGTQGVVRERVPTGVGGSTRGAGAGGGGPTRARQGT